MSDFCIDGDNDSNTMCINDFDYEKSTIIKPFGNKTNKDLKGLYLLIQQIIQ